MKATWLVSEPDQPSVVAGRVVAGLVVVVDDCFGVDAGAVGVGSVLKGPLVGAVVLANAEVVVPTSFVVLAAVDFLDVEVLLVEIAAVDFLDVEALLVVVVVVVVVVVAVVVVVVTKHFSLSACALSVVFVFAHSLLKWLHDP